jgi:hypothetical protein
MVRTCRLSTAIAYANEEATGVPTSIVSRLGKISRVIPLVFTTLSSMSGQSMRDLEGISSCYGLRQSHGHHVSRSRPRFSVSSKKKVKTGHIFSMPRMSQELVARDEGHGCSKRSHDLR